MNVQGNNNASQIPMAPGQTYQGSQTSNSYWGSVQPFAGALGSMGESRPQPPASATMPVGGYEQSENAKANTLGKTSVAFVVLGLILLGASIVPLMTYFEMPKAYGVLAFDALLMASSVGFAVMGFAHSSRTMRYAGLAIAFGTVAKMTLVDTWALDPLAKAIAYIVGAITCIAIGFLYSKAAKRAETEG